MKFVKFITLTSLFLCLGPTVAEAQINHKYLLLTSKDSKGHNSKHTIFRGQKVQVITQNDSIYKSRISYKSKDSIIVQNHTFHIKEIKTLTYTKRLNSLLSATSFIFGAASSIAGLSSLRYANKAPRNVNVNGDRIIGNILLLEGILAFTGGIILAQPKSVDLKSYDYLFTSKR